MQKIESVLENETHKILWDFKIQTYHQTSAWRTDVVLINKKKRTCQLVDFTIPTIRRQNKRKCKDDKFFDVAKKAVVHKKWGWYQL